MSTKLERMAARVLKCFSTKRKVSTMVSTPNSDEKNLAPKAFHFLEGFGFKVRYRGKIAR